MAMSEGIMTSILTYDAAEFLGVCVGAAPSLKIQMRTDSDTGLKQLKNHSIVVRNRPLATAVFVTCAMGHYCILRALNRHFCRGRFRRLIG